MLDAEANFGPAASYRFDFTLLFENAVLSILPSTLFLVLTPQRLFWLVKQPRKLTKNSQFVLKLGLIAVYTILQLTVLLCWVLGPLPVPKSQIAAAVLVFLNGFALAFLSYAEHTRSVRPSTLINVYLLLTLLFDCAIARTLWLIEGTKLIAKVFTATVAIKFTVLVSEAWEKRSILRAQYQELSPESTSGILGRSVFWWLNPLMKIGFGRPLTEEDLYTIDSSLSSRRLVAHAQETWSLTNHTKKNRLFWSTIWAAKAVFASGMLSRICLIAFKYTQPFLIQRTVGFASDLTEPKSIGWGLTGAWLLVFIGLAISNGFYYHKTYQFVTSVRGSLESLIYNKTLDLSTTAFDETIAVTLMSTDTEAICLGFSNLHEVWASPIECGVALFLLYRQLGLAFLSPMIIAIVATVGIMQLANHMGRAQKKWVRGIQTRVDVTASMLGSMKEVKMLGLTDVLNSMVQNLRIKELKLAKKARKLLVFRLILASSTQTISPLATFATFVIISQSTGQPLNVASAYTSLSLIYLLSTPMATVIRTIPMVSASLACFDRIQAFLISDSFKDHRLPLNTGTIQANDSTSLSSRSSDVIEMQNLSPTQEFSVGDPLMVVSDASFSWGQAESPILHNISCTIRKSHFTYIIGSVGSGKSTLLQAMLGEMKPSKGSIFTGTRRIAFVGQEPWIQNLTLRQNILGAFNYDKSWYDKVIYACALEQDMMELPGRDATKAGTKGVSLSGGQKQRLALARAVYSRVPVIFLDDVFAGQDAATEEHIHRMLFSERGLFREMGTTVVCVTNAIHRLVYADHVIALSEQGSILHQGTFEQLKTDTVYFKGLHFEQNGSASKDDNTITTGPGELATSSPPAPGEDTQASLGQGLGEFATYGYYLGSVPLWHVLLILSLVCLHAGGYKMTELLLSFWTGRTGATQHESNSFYLGLYGMLAGLSMAALISCAWFYLIIAVPLGSAVLHARLLKSIMDAPLSFFSKTDVGVTTTRFSQDISVVDTELPFTLIDLLINIAVAFLSAVMMCVFSGYFAATLPPILFFCWLLSKFYLRTSRQIRILELQAKSPLFTHFLDTLQGLSSVRAFSWETQFREQYFEFLDASQRPYYLQFCIQRWLALVLDLMVAAMAGIMMVLVVQLRGQFAPKFVALALLNVTSFNESLTLVIKGYTQLETAFGAVARLKQFGATTESENLAGETSQVPEEWPSSGHVSIKNMTASYTKTGNPVLHGVTLDIPAGSKVGICGRSGSGKSSLMGCLLRLLEIDANSSIEFDGIDITTIPRQTIRASVAVVPQHPFFMKKTSIRDNLAPRGERNDERMLAALHRLKMRDVIDRMGGLDSILDIDRLSQGQRQLLCLARAMLANKRIILLDEASSNVDPNSEQLIRQVIREQFVGCTVIAIVHRLGAVVDFDRVAVMSGGRVVEWDNPRELLKRDSEFKKLWDLTSG
ncbi:uncharacterized protein NECHADRAFT_52409 [Fusarium vanettenii 77-13-4]|uniref:ABC transporter n=1 Tax=Fusarium vanettenii (strain ATCC MYA-4622 / CBS 123669 / FGSC 9596 / NRRL 45880 / 77-13-4) TaxID=660122 RepID=C7ZK57_FUSV7|nr:uncharacterized protein NECHADRAFT_52409 [Fusarium vanettenii 77-13-4]EEU35583.1 hypothetical protein NECHADRAFT_52409 [Fusarium vanettenii 77-13-4]